MAGVLVEKLSKVYDDPQRRQTVEAVRDVTLAVASSELLVVVGPSGSGKTTLLRLIAGLEEPTSGTVAIHDRPVTHLPPQDRDVAMVFQEHSLYPHLTVQENLAFGLKLRRCPDRERNDRVQRVADILGLGVLLERSPKALSGGERQRVALGRALVLQPKVLLFDEPLSNLDAPMRGEIRQEILKLHRQLGTTMIYVTHDQLEAMSLADRIAVLHKGRLRQAGTPRQLYQCPADLFVARFFGAPPTNLLAGILVQVGNSIWFRESDRTGQGEMSFPVEPTQVSQLASRAASAVLLAVRPEDIHLVLDHAAPRGPGFVRATGEVTRAEFMGAETLLSIKMAQSTLVARISGDVEIPRAGQLQIDLNVTKGHFFDADSGMRLG